MPERHNDRHAPRRRGIRKISWSGTNRRCARQRLCSMNGSN